MKKLTIILLALTTVFVLTACGAKEFTVSFDSDGGSEVDNQLVESGAVSTEPTNPTKSGYNFVLWYLDDETVVFDFDTEIQNDIELTALWYKIGAYTVEFEYTGGTDVPSQSIDENGVVVVPIIESREDCTFNYWYLDDEMVAYDFNQIVEDDMVLTAKCTEKERFKVYFDIMGVEEGAFQNVYDGATAIDPGEITKDGYSFVHWYLDDEDVAYDFSTPVTSDITITAKLMEKNIVNVTFDTATGSEVPSVDLYSGDYLEMPENPVDDTHDFVYWYSDDENTEFDFDQEITNDMTLTAKWAEKPLYSIMFNSNGGSAVDSDLVMEGYMASEPNKPDLYGYWFVRWYETDNTVGYDFNTPVITDVVLNALWEVKTIFTVNFHSDGGSLISSQNIMDGDRMVEPIEPEKSGLTFIFWYETDDSVMFDMNSKIIGDLNLNARWGTEDEKLLRDDIDAYADTIIDGGSLLPTPLRGSVNSSTISYWSESEYISDGGVVLPLPENVDEGITGTWKVKFTKSSLSYTIYFDIPLYHIEEVIIAESRIIPFENLTTEYDVADTDVTLYFEEDGSIPYIKLEDFFSLLQGFIDPETNMTYTKDSDSLEVFYQYYSEEEDYTYDLILYVDATENTIRTNDPAFYWIYVYTTETNYGRHIEYIQDHPDESILEGVEVVYDLDDFNMDIVMYEDDVMLPYYMANQLFAGSAYYNVYYNYDGLYGIYSLPSDNSKEMRTIQRSSMSNSDIPVDLLLHTFDMLAFNLDNLYGLKDIMEVDTYYDLLFEMKDELLVTDSEDFEFAIRDLLLKGLDEPHTSYGYHSYFNSALFDGPPTNSLSVYGPRFTKWYYDGLVDSNDAIGAKWGEAPGNDWNYTIRPDYWFVDETVVMLSLNGFETSDIEESSSHDVSIVESMMELDDVTNLFPTIDQGDKFFYYNNSDENTRIIDVLVKGVDASYADTYRSSLISMGYELVVEETNDELKEDGYYTKTMIDGETEISYMVVVHYDEQYSLFHVGIATDIPSEYTYNWTVINEVETLIFADSAVYMEFMLQEIEEENPNITDIILDLSWNTGGNVGALYRVLGFITDSPFEVTGIDGETKGASTSFVEIGDIPDYSHLNWHLLTTPTSFSAANSLANIFKANDLGDVIGVTTGGGACSITPILLPNGTAFTMSSNNISAYRTGSGTDEDPYVYHNVEFGITPDFEIDIDDIFNTQVLLDIIYNSN